MIEAVWRKRHWAWLCELAFLHGCSGSLSDTIDEALPKQDPAYKSSRSSAPLEIPPDLSKSTINDTLVVSEAGSMTFSEYSDPDSGTNRAARQTGGILPELKNLKIERLGDKRWLVINASPAQVWPLLQDFWLEQGFIIAFQDPSIGILETDWAEKREQFNTGFIEKLLGRFSSALYGTATRDKFRTRIERGVNPDTTEVYISHRGVEEIREEINRQTGEEIRAWHARPADPELEAEMLNKMLVFLGVEENQARSMIAKTTQRPSRARVVTEGSSITALALQDSFSRAWRRTGLALDRVGFTVEDRDRSRGLYFVRYIDPYKDANVKSEEGILGKLKFWQSDDTGLSEADEYLISLIAEADETHVSVLNKQGQRERSATASRILKLLHEQLK